MRQRKASGFTYFVSKIYSYPKNKPVHIACKKKCYIVLTCHLRMQKVGNNKLAKRKEKLLDKHMRYFATQASNLSVVMELNFSSHFRTITKPGITL